MKNILVIFMLPFVLLLSACQEDIIPIQGTPSFTVTAGSYYSFTPGVTSTNNDTLEFYINNAPPWAVFNVTTGELNGTPTVDDIGTYSNIIISVSNGIITNSLPNFSILVQAVNTVPNNTVPNNTDTTPPVIDSVAVAATLNGAVISWNTNEAADSELGYGVGNYRNIKSNAEYLGTHSYTLSGLTSGETYQYKIIAKDSAGNSAATVASFTTQSPQVVETKIGDWVSPMGIPAPEFGVKETHMMYENATFDFGSGLESYRDAGNGPYTHYVNKKHSFSTDFNNPYGSLTKPRATIPKKLAAGSVVEVHNGPYTNTVNAHGGKYLPIFDVSGTASKPVFIRGANKESRFEIGTLAGDNEILIRDASYLIVENMRVNGPSLKIYQPSDHVAIRHSEITGELSSGILLWTYKLDFNPGDLKQHIVIYNNEIHDNGKYPAMAETNKFGIMIDNASKNVWVIDNNMYHNGDDSVQVIDRNWVASIKNIEADRIFIGRNIMHHDGENALDVKGATNVIISENEMYGYRTLYKSSAGEAIRINDEGRQENIWILFNRIYDSNDGIDPVNALTTPYVLGNIIHDVNVAINRDSNIVSNNTIFNCKVGVKRRKGPKYELSNNIISNCGIAYDQCSSCGTDVIYSNILFNNRSNSSNCTNCLKTDPKINAQGDLAATGSSAIKASGQLSSAYDTFFALYGIDIRKDINGNARPVEDSDWNIGAYESGDSNGTSVGTPPVVTTPVDNTPSNVAPVISGSSVNNVFAGATYAFTPSAVDADGDTLRFSVVNLPTWASLNVVTGKISGTPSNNQVGLYDGIRITVSDGTDSVSLAAFSVTVKQVAVDPVPDPDPTPDPTPTPGESKPPVAQTLPLSNNEITGVCGIPTGTPVAISFDYVTAKEVGKYITLGATSTLVEFTKHSVDDAPNINWSLRYKKYKYGNGGHAITDWRVNSAPSNGTLYEVQKSLGQGDSINDPDDLFYVPNDSYIGQDSFTYCVVDATGQSNIARVVIQVAEASQYPMPYGIPHPGFGIADKPPADPAQWPGAEKIGYYYIDSDHAQCSNANIYGYPNVPRCSIPSGASVVAGGKMVLANSNSPYNLRNNGKHYVKLNGAIGNTSWIVGNEKGPNKPVIRAHPSRSGMTELSVTGGYWRIAGVVFDGPRLRHTDSSAKQVVVRHSEFKNFNSTQGGGTTVSLKGVGVLALNVYAHDNGIVEADGLSRERDIHAFVGSSQKGYWMLDIRCDENAGDCVQLTNNNTTSDVYVGRMVAHSEGENCIDYKNFNRVVVSESDCWDLRKVKYGNSGGNAQAFYLNDEGIQKNYAYFLNNRAWDIAGSTYGFSNLGGRAYLIGNISFASPKAIGYNSGGGQGSRYVYFNTFSDSTVGIMNYSSGAAADRYVVGNVIDGASVYQTRIRAATNVVNKYDYNFYRDLGVFASGGSSPSEHIGIAALTSATGFEKNGQEGVRTGFFDVGTYDFRPTITSGDISGSVPLSVVKQLPLVTDIFNDLGVKLLDRNGNLRDPAKNYTAGAIND